MYYNEYAATIKDYPSFLSDFCERFLHVFPLAQLECFNAVVNNRDSLSCTRNVLGTCYKQLKNILYTVSEV